MKRDDKKALLALSLTDMKQKMGELQVFLSQARQANVMQDKTKIDVKQGSKALEQIKMIKAEMRRRELVGE